MAVAAPLLLAPWLPSWGGAILQSGMPAALIFIVSVAVIEEVIFRGGVQGWLLRKEIFKIRLFGVSRANWLTSALFAGAHLWQHPAYLVPGYLVVSLVLGYFRERYRGIRIPVALHGWYNLVLLLMPELR